jgi:hypothetical protein
LQTFYKDKYNKLLLKKRSLSLWKTEKKLLYTLDANWIFRNIHKVWNFQDEGFDRVDFEEGWYVCDYYPFVTENADKQFKWSKKQWN